MSINYEQSIRKVYAEVLAITLSRLDDFQLAEDCVQEACLRALDDWQRNTIPDHPKAWLLRVAQRLAIDHYRKHQRWDKLTPYLAHELELRQENETQQNQQVLEEFNGDAFLKLIFTCCHTELPQEDQIALALKCLMGLSVYEISKALLKKNKTIEQRITRAKKKIQQQKLSYDLPTAKSLHERVNSVLKVIYLIFNEGYLSSLADSPIRRDLCEQAICLGQSLAELLETNAESFGLLALMLGHHARSRARLSSMGEWVSLEKQDRSLWKKEYIDKADRYLTLALGFGQPGTYQLQAAVIALHNSAASFESTDWKQILLLYNVLLSFQENAVTLLNRTIAQWYTNKNHREALEALMGLKEHHPELSEYTPYHVALGYVYEALEEKNKAIEAFKDALSLTNNSADKKVLIRKINH